MDKNINRLLDGSSGTLTVESPGDIVLDAGGSIVLDACSVEIGDGVVAAAGTATEAATLSGGDLGLQGTGAGSAAAGNAAPPAIASQSSPGAAALQGTGAASKGRLLVNKVEGKGEAPPGEKVEYKVSRYSIDGDIFCTETGGLSEDEKRRIKLRELCAEDRMRIKWAVKVGKGGMGYIVDEKGNKVCGDRISLGMDGKWAGERILVMACVEGFNEKVSQETMVGTSVAREEGTEANAESEERMLRVVNAYFAEKIIENEGTRVRFEQITFSILGKTVYLIVETENMQDEELNVSIRSRGAVLGAGALQVMRFDSASIANNAQLPYVAATEIRKEIGNFDDLNNNQNTHAHYTNLADHANKAIVKLQLRPNDRATFNNWAAAIGERTANLELVVRKNGGECYYGNSEERADEGNFLNGDNGFTVENKNFYEIHNENNAYNFLPVRTNGIERRRIGELKSHYLDAQNRRVDISGII